MKLETGKPVIDGRYVVYVPGFKEWLEPYIVLWHKGQWTHRNSSEPYPDNVQCWTGPLPVIDMYHSSELLRRDAELHDQDELATRPDDLEYDL